MKTTLEIEINQVTLDTTITAAGPQGPKGDKGEKGDLGDDVALYAAVAGEVLQGHRLVRLEAGRAYKTTCLDLAHKGQALGVTRGAALTDEEVKIQMTGVLTEPSWNFSPGSVWLSSTGTLTSTAPTTGFRQQVGRAVDAHSLLIILSPIVVLE